MAQVSWIGNAQATAQVVNGAFSGIVNGSVLTATINTKVLSYTALSTDTPASACQAFVNLLSAQGAPPEFGALSWSISSTSTTTVQATANVAGTPFAGMTNGLVFSASAGASVVQTTATANSSPSDLTNPLNWSRSGINALPQTGDDVVVSNTFVPILYNLTGLSGVILNSWTRWQDFTGTIGLPENNPLGYVEYLPTYLVLTMGAMGSSSASAGGSGQNVVLGVGNNGSGPSRERYNFGSSFVNLALIASGSAADDYAVRFLGTNAGNVVSVVGSSLGIAMLPGEVATILSASAASGGTIACGPFCTFTGTLTVSAGTATLLCAPSQVIVQANSTLNQETSAQNVALTYPSLIVRTGSQVNWFSGSNIVNLILQTNSKLDKSQDIRAMNMGAVTMDADTCQINDPYNTITWTGTVTLNNNLPSGPIILGNGRSIRIT